MYSTFSGTQPKKGLTLQIPFCQKIDTETDDEMVIVTGDEKALLDGTGELEVIDTPPKIVNGNLIVEISHFSM